MKKKLVEFQGQMIEDRRKNGEYVVLKLISKYLLQVLIYAFLVGGGVMAFKFTAGANAENIKTNRKDIDILDCNVKRIDKETTKGISVLVSKFEDVSKTIDKIDKRQERQESKTDEILKELRNR